MTKRRGAMPMCGAPRAAVLGAALLALLPALSTPAAGQAMSLAGKLDVSPSGAAGYAIPIAVPAGTAGMAPSLSLEYSSQGGDGILGIGWSLGGLPAVARCPRTTAQDGVHGSVNYDANDRFCLSGQRLIAISGTYGADGAEYRTEVESFSRVISHGTAGTGPAWFEAHTKSGQVMQFGNTTDSRVLAQGKTTARAWGVNKVADTKGNYYTVTYVNDTTNGQAYPSRIDYTANAAAGLAAYNSVQFVYNTARPDVTPLYRAGSLLKTTVLLTDVQTFAGSTMVADYKLAYQQGSATLRSRLVSVTLCGAGNSCLPATTFAWQDGGTTPSLTTNVAGQDGNLIGYRPYPADFNGDGMADILWDAENLSPAYSTGTRVSWTSTGGGSFAVNSNFAGQNGTLSGYAPIVADFNRDGRSDVWWYQVDTTTGAATGPTTTWFSTNTGSFTVNTGPSVASGSYLSQLADVNGDNRADIFWSNGLTMTIWLTNPNGTVTTVSDSQPYSSSALLGTGPRLAGPDFNGDGFADVLWLQPGAPNNGMASLWFGNGDGTFRQVAGADTSVAGYLPYLGDFNGDGNTDILWDNVDSSGRSTGTRILWLSRGDGTFVVTTNVSGQNGTLVGYRPYLGDFNGDGKTDVLWVQQDTSGVSTGPTALWVGKGDGTFTLTSNFGGGAPVMTCPNCGPYGPHTYHSVPILADFNGDGKTDVLWDARWYSDTSKGYRDLWLSDGIMPDVITSITTGLGATVAIAYKPLTNSTVYTKDSNAVDPTADLQAPIYVVSRVDAPNGIGGNYSSSYSYAGAKVDQNGRGFLGFRQVAITDLQTNIVQTTNYRQDYPYVSLVASQTKTLSGATLNSVANTYGSTALGGTRYQVFLTQSQAASFDLDGTALPTVTSSYQNDAYGNATQVIVSTSDGFSKTTTNTYTNDSANWLLGRLTGATVTSQSP